MSFKIKWDKWQQEVYTKDKGITYSGESSDDRWYESFYDKRDDKVLIETIEELGEKEASGKLANIRIIEIPDDIRWELDNYDGIESIHEEHQSW